MVKFKEGKVFKPIAKSGKSVCNFLKYISKTDFDKAPKYYGSNADEYILSYIEGDTYDLDYPIIYEKMLISSAKLLREYHDVSEKFVKYNLTEKDSWLFKSVNPVEIICHNDFAPYNICYKNSEAIGIIDFETIAPGPRIWDISYALYRFAPFMDLKLHDYFGTINDQIIRAKIFCNAYGLEKNGKLVLADIIIDRLRALSEFLIKSAEEGDIKYTHSIGAGDYDKYLNDIEYIKVNQNIINKIFS